MVVEEEEDVEPVIEHQLAERTQLQQILCDFSRDLSPQDIVSRPFRHFFFDGIWQLKKSKKRLAAEIVTKLSRDNLLLSATSSIKSTPILTP